MEIENGGAEIQVYRDNELAITWTDSTPLMSGSYLVLRTNNSQVAFDDVQANEVALSYLHNDHLGSNSLMTDAAGTIVPNSQAVYLPFGDWRNEPGTTNLTDLGYTGHRHNNTATNDLGLIYMNARYYLPGTGRFASADTIIPDPLNSQSHNRFSYVHNNPVFFTDPTGHCAENGDESCWSLAESLSRQFGIGLEYLGRLSYTQLSNTEIATVLAFTVSQLEGSGSDVSKMMNILAFAIDEVAGGDIELGLGYLAAVFYRPNDLGRLGVPEGFRYSSVSDSEFGVTGFHPLYQDSGGNQVEHFIGEAYIIARFGNNELGTVGVAVGNEIVGLIRGRGENPDFYPDMLLGFAAGTYVREMTYAVSPKVRALVTNETEMMLIQGPFPSTQQFFNDLTNPIYRAAYWSPVQ